MEGTVYVCFINTTIRSLKACFCPQLHNIQFSRSFILEDERHVENIHIYEVGIFTFWPKIFIRISIRWRNSIYNAFLLFFFYIIFLSQRDLVLQLVCGCDLAAWQKAAALPQRKHCSAFGRLLHTVVAAVDSWHQGARGSRRNLSRDQTGADLGRPGKTWELPPLTARCDLRPRRYEAETLRPLYPVTFTATVQSETITGAFCQSLKLTLVFRVASMSNMMEPNYIVVWAVKENAASRCKSQPRPQWRKQKQEEAAHLLFFSMWMCVRTSICFYCLLSHSLRVWRFLRSNALPVPSFFAFIAAKPEENQATKINHRIKWMYTHQNSGICSFDVLLYVV